MNNDPIIKIPVMPTIYPHKERDYPISERDNLMLALNHKKPLWMPNFETCSNLAPGGVNGDQPFPNSNDFTDWFGVFHKYTSAQESCTPISTVFSSIDEWKDKVVFPDLDSLDWNSALTDYERDENKALYGRFLTGVFERFHTLAGFETALIDMICKPQEVREFMEEMADFEIEVFHRMNNVLNYDFFIHHDDWGTNRAPFFSRELFEQTILPPTIRIISAIRDAGVIPVFHSCGLIDDYIPYIIDEIGADSLEIQPINDIKNIIKTYGTNCTVQYARPDPYFFYNPSTTIAQIKEKAREIVDIYGAHVNPGAGAIYKLLAPNEEVYFTFDEEIYRYSLIKYNNL